MDRPAILFTYPVSSSFIEQDINSFKEFYSVKEFRFQPVKKIILPISFLRQKIFLLLNISSAEILICQFAGYHSLLPVIFARIFRKPSLIIVGGTDCISIPSINYGNYRKPLLGWFTRMSLRLATHITAPGESLIESDYTFKSIENTKQGLRNLDSLNVTPYTIIHNGINISLFMPVEGVERKKTKFLTICTYIDQRNFILKGLDLFVNVAKKFPDCEFTIIDKMAKGFTFERPRNLILADFIPNELLPSKMSEYTYYCQLSISEGFGVSLAEAMACGCIPIVSNVGIMKYIAGDSGFILEKYDTNMLYNIIIDAMNSDTLYLSLRARNRIRELFDNRIRQAALFELVRILTRK